MLSELAHLCLHAPATLALKRRLPQDELYATLIARADAAGLSQRRAELVHGLRGHVVEIGCGTGSMFGHYRNVSVTAIEPDPAFAAHARVAARLAPVEIEVRVGSGEAIPLEDASVDAAVLALVLCSVESAEVVCREVARVVRPGGSVRLIEHVRSPKRIAGALMDLANPLWLRVNGQGCRLNRDPIPVLAGAGIHVERVESFQLWSAGLPAFPMRSIHATRDARRGDNHATR
ncbi:MAG: methyltransferase type 11 [Deltaproteobacteria bacterium]|nr:methyltransferase type 11 [Deltaproteobacteria bacterium]